MNQLAEYVKMVKSALAPSVPIVPQTQTQNNTVRHKISLDCVTVTGVL